MSGPNTKHQAPWPDLACQRLGGKVLDANDDFFAEKENLILESEPVWDQDRYTDRGKWMDGWESRRRRTPGHDWCLVRLACPGRPIQVVVDTAFFTGNYPEYCSLEAVSAPANATLEQLEQASWREILPKSALKGDHENLFEIKDSQRTTHVRLRIYPDGGVARLRVFAEALPSFEPSAALSTPSGREAKSEPMNVASALLGGRILDVSDRFYSVPDKLLLPDEPRGMFDGWETKRRRDNGNDWVVVGFAAVANLHKVIIDTRFFKGNAPGWCSIETACLGNQPLEQAHWSPLLERTALEPHTVHTFEKQLLQPPAGDCARLQIYPDGGVARLQTFGDFDPASRLALGLRRLHLESSTEAKRRLMSCCHSQAWAQAMVDQRPFGSVEELVEASHRTWQQLSSDDWLEAFEAHPRIGSSKPADEADATSRQWSEKEQEGVRDASNETMAALRQANEDYFQTFGFIFLICATGMTATQMLAQLQQRLTHTRQEELSIAAQEQAKITRLRLEALLTQ